jgi:hypothetical protein
VTPLPQTCSKRALLLLTGLWGACALPDPTVEEVGLSPAEALEQAFAQGESATRNWLQAVADPLERDMLLHGLVEKHPGETYPLCELLTAEGGQERCTRINGRPHLWMRPPLARDSAPRAAGGPSPGTLELPATLVNSYDAIPLSANDCAQHVYPHTCYERLSQEAVLAGNPEDAGRACMLFEEEPWRSECFFQAAELRLKAPTAPAYADAVSLCLAAGDYRDNCIQHLFDLLGNFPKGEERMMEQILERSDFLEIWTHLAPELLPDFQQIYWSRVINRGLVAELSTAHRATLLLPAEAQPHVRASTAWRLIILERPEARSLEGWITRLGEVLEPDSTVELPAPQVHPPMSPVIDLWPRDRPEDAEMPAIYYLGISRRTTDEDPEIDLALCVLEAAARIAAPGRISLLAEGRAHPHPKVRWTAERLSQRPTPEGAIPTGRRRSPPGNFSPLPAGEHRGSPPP